MWDWERASVPFQPIYRRRLWRRRLLVFCSALAIVVPYLLIHHQRETTPVGARVFDDVTTAISMRYFDWSYHGLDWNALTRQYRPLVAAAPTVERRYALMRQMLRRLGDSHTLVYSPSQLKPPDPLPRHGIFGMTAGRAGDPSSIVDWKSLSRDVGYLRLGSFPNAIEPVLGWAMADVGRKSKLILDLRGNPGGLVDSVDSAAGVFLPAGTLISTGLRRYHFFGPQRFVASDSVGARYNGRLVVLVDRGSRSGAESLARALQYYHRATIVGTRTAGKVLGVDLEINLADGGMLRVATLDMRAPDGRRLEGRGVTPDVFVAASRRRDAQLDRAFQLLQMSRPLWSASRDSAGSFSSRETLSGSTHGTKSTSGSGSRPARVRNFTGATPRMDRRARRLGRSSTRAVIISIPAAQASC